MKEYLIFSFMYQITVKIFSVEHMNLEKGDRIDMLWRINDFHFKAVVWEFGCKMENTQNK